MKIIISLFAAFLMTDGGSCRPATFLDNSRIVIEGKAIDSLGNPLANENFIYDNHINFIESKTKSDGSFMISTPITDQGSKIIFTEKTLVDFQCNNPKIVKSYNDILIFSNMTYVKFESITLK